MATKATPGRTRGQRTGAGSGQSGTTVTDLAAYRRRRRELIAWAQAVLWLHDRGLPAAAPYDVAGWLRAHGVEADWYHRNPCCPWGCGQGCWVLAADGEAPPPDIHVCAVIAPTGTGAR
jgi:hypothetical protein